MLKRIFSLTFLCLLLFCVPRPSAAQTSGDNAASSRPADVAVMTFVGDDLALSAQLHDAVVDEVRGIAGYTPQLVTLEEFPESISFPPDEPPAPSYLGATKYVLTGEFYIDMDEEMQHFQLWLWKSADGSLVYTDELMAEDMDEAMSYMPALVSWVFSRIPEERNVTLVQQSPQQSDINIRLDQSGNPYEVVNDPLNRWLYVGLRAGGSFRFYILPTLVKDYSSNFTQSFSYEAAVQLGFRFLSFMSVQVEAVFTQDSAPFRGPKFQLNETEIRYVYYTDSYNSKSLMFPVTVKFPLEFAPYIVSPFAGAYFILPLGQMEVATTEEGKTGGSYEYAYSLQLGITFGVDLGVRLGPGILFLDLRYNGDLGNTIVQMDDGTTREYTRNMFSFSLGYELAILNKRRRVRE
jgi:hypothetical protein